MKIKILGLIGLIILAVSISRCQKQPVIISPQYSISPIAPIKNHYKTLQVLDSNPDPSRANLDGIQYPSKAYGWIASFLVPSYLERAQLKKMYLQLKPPANSSEQTRAELDFLLELQNSRTEEQVKEVLEINEVVYVPVFSANKKDLFYICRTVMGEKATASNYPNTKKLLHNIMKESRIMEFTAKNHFMRARPYQLETQLKPLKKIQTPSYASGHTLWAYLQGYILAELIPEKRKEFIDTAYETGFSREVLGVHYPSDEEAARQLSYQMFEAMWVTEKFQKDFKKAKAEWGNLQ